jgi:rubrerythrin
MATDVTRFHEQLLAQVRASRRQIATRRGFLTGSAKLAGGGAAALAFAGLPILGGARRAGAAQQAFASDLDVVQYALTLEHLEYAFYRDGLRDFSQADFDELYPSSLYEILESIRNHEGTHVEQLTAAVKAMGGEPVEEAVYDFGYENIEGFIEVAAALENTGVAAYAGAAPSIADPEVLAVALGIHSVEARHAAYLNTRLGELPAPVSNDAAKGPVEILEIAGGFFVEG